MGRERRGLNGARTQCAPIREHHVFCPQSADNAAVGVTVEDSMLGRLGVRDRLVTGFYGVC